MSHTSCRLSGGGYISRYYIFLRPGLHSPTSTLEKKGNKPSQGEYLFNCHFLLLHHRCSQAFNTVCYCRLLYRCEQKTLCSSVFPPAIQVSERVSIYIYVWGGSARSSYHACTVRLAQSSDISITSRFRVTNENAGGAGEGHGARRIIE